MAPTMAASTAPLASHPDFLLGAIPMARLSHSLKKTIKKLQTFWEPLGTRIMKLFFKISSNLFVGRQLSFEDTDYSITAVLVTHTRRAYKVDGTFEN
jgi:hypothetical protein